MLADTFSAFLDDLRNHPIGQRILADRASAVRERRRELIARRAALHAEHERDSRDRTKALAALAVRRDAAQAKAREADETWCEAQRADISASYVVQQRAGALDAELAATADGRIQAAIDRVHETFNRKRDGCWDVELARDMANRWYARGNGRAIDRFITTHLAAIERLRTLKLVDLAPEDVDDAIAKACMDFDDACAHLSQLDAAPDESMFAQTRPQARRPSGMVPAVMVSE
jgi:hypothetical protein